MQKVIILIFILLGISCNELSENSKTDLLGPDKNNNQVRDDVDQYINENFKGLNNKKAVTEYARLFQNRFNLPLEKSHAEENSKKIGKALDCYTALNPDKYRSYMDLEPIDNLILNTKERILASAKIDQVMAGSVMSNYDYGLKGCSFEIIDENTEPSSL